MAEENTTPEVELESTQESAPEVDYAAKLAELEAQNQELLAEKEKWRTRAKRSKKKAKELIATKEEPTPSAVMEHDVDDDSEYRTDDRWDQFVEFKTRQEFKEIHPDVNASELKEVKRLAKEEGYTPEAAWKIFQYDRMTDPSAKAQQDTDRTAVHGGFTKSKSTKQDDLKAKLLAKLGYTDS